VALLITLRTTVVLSRPSVPRLGSVRCPVSGSRATLQGSLLLRLPHRNWRGPVGTGMFGAASGLRMGRDREGPAQAAVQATEMTAEALRSGPFGRGHPWDGKTKECIPPWRRRDRRVREIGNRKANTEHNTSAVSFQGLKRRRGCVPRRRKVLDAVRWVKHGVMHGVVLRTHRSSTRKGVSGVRSWQAARSRFNLDARLRLYTRSYR